MVGWVQIEGLMVCGVCHHMDRIRLHRVLLFLDKGDDVDVDVGDSGVYRNVCFGVK